VTCQCCDSIGLYDFNCKRCIARLYVRALPREQQATSKVWRATLTPEEQDEMRRLIEEQLAEQ
jgi:hypothetical protein